MNRLISIVISFCVFSLLYCLFNIGVNNFYTISLLPFSFLVLTIFFHKVYKLLSKSTVFNIFIFQACIRYCALPTLISLDPVFMLDSESYYNIAILIMVLELLFVFIMFIIFSNKQNDAYINRKINILPLQSKLLLPIFLILIFYYIYTTGAFTKINMIWNLSDYIEQSTISSDSLEETGFGIIFFNLFKSLTALYFISIIYKTNKIKQANKKWLYLTVVFLSSLFIVGSSRLSFILFAIPLLVLIGFLVKVKDYKKIAKAALVFILVLIVSTTIAKFTRYDNVSSIEKVITISSLNIYFSGPQNIAIGLKVYENKKSYESVFYLINDTFQNVPLLSKITVDKYKLTVKFNEEIYGHSLYADQIVPLSISGLFHFSFLGVFFYSSFFITIALYMERLSYKLSFIAYKYLFIYLSVIFSLVFMANLGSLYGSLFGSLLFLFIPFALINMFQRIKMN